MLMTYKCITQINHTRETSNHKSIDIEIITKSSNHKSIDIEIIIVHKCEYFIL